MFIPNFFSEKPQFFGMNRCLVDILSLTVGADLGAFSACYSSDQSSAEIEWCSWTNAVARDFELEVLGWFVKTAFCVSQ